MGLLELCKKHSTQPHEVMSPPTGAFSFDMTIPSDRLPESRQVKGAKLQVYLTFQLGDDAFVHSDVAEVTMGE